MSSHSQASNNDDLYSLIQSRTGLILNVHQRNDVTVLLDDLAQELDTALAPNLFTLLSQSPSTHPLWQRIVHVITVGETYFFRNTAQFNAISNHILPLIIEEKRKEGHKVLRIWSAGSATGEEPYTIAMLLRQVLPDIDSWNINLLATDINEAYLQQAQEGLYRARAFRTETPAEIRDRWFLQERDGYRLSPIIRNMVSFRLLNLVSDDYPGFASNTMHMDIIFCRNVTIYFDRQTTRRIAQRFHNTLNSNGWLVVGHAEPQSDVYQGFAPRNFKDTVIYQKLTAGLSVSSPLPPSFQKQTTPNLPMPIKKSVSKNPAPSVKVPVLKAAPAATRASKPGPQIKTPVPSTIEGLWERAKQAADSRNWHEARKWLDQAEEKDKFRPEVHYLRGLVELESGNISYALQLLRRSIYCNVNFPLAHSALGDVYAQQGAHKEAVRHWNLALGAIESIDPKQVLPYSDNLTVEELVALLVDRLTGL